MFFDLLPEYFGKMVFALAAIFAVVMVLFVIGWRFIDWLTPGVLNEQLVPPNSKNSSTPNIALAIVVASLVVGLSFIIGCTTIGVLTH